MECRAGWRSRIGCRPDDHAVTSGTTPPVTPDLSAQTVPHDDDSWRGHYVGECGHPVPLGDQSWDVGPCPRCEPCPLILLGDPNTGPDDPHGDTNRVKAWTDADLGHWIALRRILDGGVIQLDGHYWVDHGRTPPDYVIDALTQLLDAGLVMLADPDPKAAAVTQAVLTTTGAAHYGQLTQTGMGMSGDQVIDLLRGRWNRPASPHPH